MKNNKKFVRVNYQISCPMVRVTKDGESLGVMPVEQARRLAQDEGLDLVEVAPMSTPPVCSIMDYQRYRFEMNKKLKDQKQKAKAVKPKEIRLRPVSDPHDVDIKINQVKKFLQDKHSVYVNIIFKNRELLHKDQGRKIMEKVIEAVSDLGKIEGNPHFEGKNLSVRFLPK